MDAKVKELVDNVYHYSGSLTEEFGDKIEVSKDVIYTLSVCPRHRSEAGTIEYLTDAELMLFYDGYSYSQVLGMQEADTFPLKVVSTWEVNNEFFIGLELDNNGEINVDLTLEDLYELYSKDYQDFLNQLKGGE